MLLCCLLNKIIGTPHGKITQYVIRFSSFVYGQNGTTWQISNTVLKREARCSWGYGTRLKEVASSRNVKSSTLSIIDTAKGASFAMKQQSLCQITNNFVIECILSLNSYYQDWGKPSAATFLWVASSEWNWPTVDSPKETIADIYHFLSFFVFFLC